MKYKKRRGRRTYYEWHSENAEIYVLGSAVIDDIEGDKLAVSDGKDKFPFIISNESETDMLRQGRKGLLGLGVAQNSTVFLDWSCLVQLVHLLPPIFFFCSNGSLFFAISMFALMYNDLIFLRNRVSRAWANIEVSLKKGAI